MTKPRTGRRRFLHLASLLLVTSLRMFATEQTATVQVNATDAFGKPVEATIESFRRHDGKNYFDSFSKLRAEGIPYGNYLLVVASDRRKEEVRLLNVFASTVVVNIGMVQRPDRGVVLNYNIRGVISGPLSDDIRLGIFGKYAAFAESVQPAKNGAFELANLPEGAYVLTVFRGDTVIQSQAFSTSGESTRRSIEINVTLPR